MKLDLCPCGSNKLFQNCCQLYFDDKQFAKSAKQLMCSRFSAYVKVNVKYILTSWHHSTRPMESDLGDINNTTWTQLYVVKSSNGLKQDTNGSVEFVAYFTDNHHRHQKLHEISQFIKENDRWFYVDGKIITNSSFQPGRNSPCYCGSGKKFKQCCLLK
ncbi:MAG: YchJ family protein [Gammaproteobacteria bacterium]